MNINNPILNILISLVAGFIGGWWGHHLASQRDARNRIVSAKDRFTTDVISIFDGIPKRGDLWEFYCNSRAKVRLAAKYFSRFLEPKELAALDALAEEYEKVNREDLNVSKFDADRLNDLRERTNATELVKPAMAGHEILINFSARLLEVAKNIK